MKEWVESEVSRDRVKCESGEIKECNSGESVE